MSTSESETKRRSESRTVRCAGCNSLYPASKTADGELVPLGVESGERCANCGGEDFARVILRID